MKIRIHVTEEVLKKTKFCGSVQSTMNGESITKSCAIAYAIRQLFPTAEVNYGRIYFIAPTNRNLTSDDYNDGRRCSILPFDARSFITTFDALSHQPNERLNLDPFSFDIDVPSEVIDQIGIGEAYRILSESKTLELVQP